MTISRDKERGERIKQEQCVDDKKIMKRDGFLYLKVKMTRQHKMGIPVGLVLLVRLKPGESSDRRRGLVAQWTTRRSTEPKIAGSTPAEVVAFYQSILNYLYLPILKEVKNDKEGRVYVTHVTNGSLSAECLIVGDRILQVDGINVNDKEMARKIIVQGLLSGNVTIIVERPDSPKARNFASEVLSIRTPPNAEKSKQV
uniref:PDZ domain-containing protein n=1 Tax=Elaeophora elaphi TaxID=1147741 RepID=A0A0R3S5J6_9BILA